MAVSPHPSLKPSPPRRPPSDREGQGKRESGQEGVSYGAKHEFGGYEHSKEHSHNDYGHDMSMKVHGHGDHKSEFANTVEGGAEGDFPKAGDKDEY